MVVSGLLCFLLQKSWFVQVNYKWKIPFFALLGVSFAFIIIFLFADCINYCALTCPRSQPRPMIESTHQVYVLAASAAVMGFLYGLIFGLLDIEDASAYQLAMLAMRQETYSYPIGMAIGTLAGLLNEFMREHGGQLAPTTDSARFEQEI